MGKTESQIKASPKMNISNLESRILFKSRWIKDKRKLCENTFMQSIPKKRKIAEINAKKKETRVI